MANVIATIILLIISIFVINLFPAGNEFFTGIWDRYVQKKEVVTEEIDRVKGEIEDTKEKVDETVDTVGKVVNTTSEILDKVNGFFSEEPEEAEETVSDDSNSDGE